MAKIRVYELARELKMESKALLTIMKDLGIQVPSHQSALTSAQIEKIRANVTSDKPKVVVRRRRKSESSEVTQAASSSVQASESTSNVVDKTAKPNPYDIKPDENVLSSLRKKAGSGASFFKEAKKNDFAAKTSEDETDRVKGNSLRSEKPLSEVKTKDDLAAEKTSIKSSILKKPDELQSSDSKLPQVKNNTEASVSNPVEKSDLMTSEVKVKEDKVKEKISEEADEKAETSTIEASSLKTKKLEKAKGVLEEKPAKELSKELPKMAQKVDLSASAAATSKVSTLKKDSQKEKSAKPVSEEMKASKRNSFSGATIVRKATVEETEATKATEEARQRTSRREDSRGIRVTGIGVNPRMGRSEAKKAEIPAPKGKFKNNSATPAPANSLGQHEDQDDLSSAGKWTGKGKLKDKGSFKKEDEERVPFKVPVHSSKRRVSMRELLDDTTTVDEPYSGGRKRRTVYTPTAQQRKKDAKRRRDLKSTTITTPRAAYRIVKISGSNISIAELAKQLSVKAAELIKKLMAQGIMATVNQTIDFDTASLLASEYDYECKNVEITAEDVLSKAFQAKEFETRAPIITVMGHVDHGKTSILDVIRKANVAEGESGGITQHIGAYMVEKEGFKFTFLDTPGHAAFSAMRARGAQITDIVVLVVAADDGVMPQTIEAISHAKNAGVPIIVAVNKIDKPNINLERLYTELSEHGVQTEDWGGDTQFVKVSALKGEGIEDLLEAIQIQSEILELKAPIDCRAEGAIVEAHLDKGRGPVATIMVMKGILKIGDYIVAGKVTGKVRAMMDHLGQNLQSAHPSVPVEVVGLTEVPMSGDQVNAIQDDKIGREIADLRRTKEESEKSGMSSASTLDELLGKVSASEVLQVNLIIKADTQGSVEAIEAALSKLNNEKVKNVVVHRAVGGINESDLNLAETSKAVMLAFNVRASSFCSDLAEKRGVVIKYFSVIYDLVDTVKSLMAGVLPPIETEVVQGHAEVRNAINVPKIGTIAGSSVIDGKITRSSKLRLIRDEIVIFSGKVGSLRRFKDDVKEVQNGYECGISIDGYTDVKVGDIIEAFMIEETAATLDFTDI